MSTALLPVNLPLERSLLKETARRDFDFWCEKFEPLLSMRRGVEARLREIANETGTPYRTVRNKFYAGKSKGMTAWIDKRLAGPRYWNTKTASLAVDESDQELVKLYCGLNQRSSRAAVKQLRRDWVKGKPTDALKNRLGAEGYEKLRQQLVKQRPLDQRTQMPCGWSIDNLTRYAPTEFELKSIRIGRGAAASERQLVYTSRQGLYVGSHIMFDDMWHNLDVNTFGEYQAGRPLELFSHDLFSARKIRWGVRVRTKRDDGTHNQLTERMTRMILAATLYCDGYSPRGTVLIEEAGTARLSRGSIERDLAKISGDLITIAGGGMQEAKTHAGMYPPIARGNPRIKASLESSNNLIQNVFAPLPGQTGKDRNHMPEEHPALMKNNADLLAARKQLMDRGEIERANEVQFLLLELNEFMRVAHALYDEIENDTEHDLNDWIECGHVVNELLLGGQWIDQRLLLQNPAQAELALTLIQAGSLSTRPRKMSRREVWNRGAADLIRLPGHGVCAILGSDLAEERKVDRDRFEFRDKEVGPGMLRYEAVAVTPYGERISLRHGETYETFVNPFASETLFVRRADGSYIGECRQIGKPCRADVEAVQRRCGEVAAREAELLAPIRVRHLEEGREKARRHAHNVAVLGGKPVTMAERMAAIADKKRVTSASDFLPSESSAQSAVESFPTESEVPARNSEDSDGDQPRPIASASDFM